MADMDDDVEEVTVDGEMDAPQVGAARGIAEFLSEDIEDDIMRLYDNVLFALKARGTHESRAHFRRDREKVARAFLQLVEFLENDVEACFDFVDVEYRDGNSFVDHLAEVSEGIAKGK